MSGKDPREAGKDARSGNVRSARVVLLTNFVPPYRTPLFRILHESLGQFHILISTPMEANRPWKPEWNGLSVRVQRTITIARRRQHPHGFKEVTYVHVPYDTMLQLASIRPEVIIAGELGARTLQSLLYRLLFPKTRIIIWATLSEVTEVARGRLRRRLRSFMLPRADAVLVNGASGRRYVRSFGVADRRIFTAPYTTDMRDFLRIPLTRGPGCQRRFLYCGQLIERKGLMALATTLGQWAERHPDNEIELCLVGDGAARPALERFQAPANLSFKFVGNVSYGDLPTWYARTGIFVFPTLADEWGLVVNEALASGLPVLGSLYSQAVEELVRDGQNGWTFFPDRPREMFAALDRALTVPESKLQEMRVGARRSVEHLTPEFAAHRILDAVRFLRAVPLGNDDAR